MSERLEKFTEGPWVRWKGHASVHAATEATNNDEGSIGRTRGQICECNADDHGNCESQGERVARANADLIAAAPDLYEAAKWAEWLLQTDEITAMLNKHYQKWGDPCEVQRMLSSALKKARGE